MPEIIEQIGAYAGFAAMVGLAVLSALYFSQARDVKRLREWAGRAPEREPAERAALQQRAQAAAQAAQQRTQTPQAQGAQQTAQGGKPAPASAAGATATASPPKPGAPGQAKPAGANGGPAKPGGPAVPAKPGAPAGPAKAPPVGGTPRIPAPQQTAILPPSARADAPWYRRLPLPEPRVLAMVAAGILVLGGGAVVALTQLGGGEPATTPAADEAQGTPAGQADNTPPTPADITVSVLNGTTVTGLASQYRDALEEAGYDVGNAANFVDQAKAESVVMYSGDARPAARVVAEDLEIGQIERVDAESQRLGGNASVIVVLGADKTP